jgi:transcriptional regulator with GAF, ATPase, and Fis domain
MKNRFAQQWLDILCQTLPESHSALLMAAGDSDKNLRPLAKWPEDLSHTNDFNPIFKYTLNKNQHVCIPNVLQPDQQHYDFFGVPIFIDTHLLGVLVIKCQHDTPERQQAILKSLEQSLQWWQLATLRLDQNDAFYASVVGLLAASFEQHSYQEVLINLATELTRRFDCEKVAIGEFKAHHSSVVAISNNAQLQTRSNLLQKIADAMDEAIEQDTIVVIPYTKPIIVNRAHQELSRKFGYGSLLTVPMLHDGKCMGAISLMRSEEQPFDNDTVRLCEQTFALIAPFLALKKADEQSLTTKIAGTLKQRIGECLGVKHLKFKLVGLALACCLLMTSVLRSDFNLTADAVLEGKMQRVVAAPINGFLLSASVRAGDAVNRRLYLHNR